MDKKSPVKKIRISRLVIILLFICVLVTNRSDVRAVEIEEATWPISSSEDVERWQFVPFIRDGNVCILDREAGGVSQITSSGRASDPVLSPDGTKIAYLLTEKKVVSGAPSSREIRVIETDGANAVTASSGSGSVSSPSWSPDSRRIAFVERNRLVVVDLYDMSRMILATNARFDGVGAPRPAWSPDGESIMCALEEGERSTLWSVKLDDRSRKKLAEFEYRDTPYGFLSLGEMAYVRPSKGNVDDLCLINTDLTDKVLLQDVIDFSSSPNGDVLGARRSDGSLWLIRLSKQDSQKVSDEGETIGWIDDSSLIYETYDGIYQANLTDTDVDNLKLADLDGSRVEISDRLELTTATLDTPWRTQFSGICENTNCGPASLGMSMAYWGTNHSNDTIRRAINDHVRGDENDCGGSGHGTLWTELEWYAKEQAEFETVGPSSGWSLESIQSQVAEGRPVLLLVHFKSLPGHEGSDYTGDHFIVFQGIRDDQLVSYDDPAFWSSYDGSNRTMTQDKLIEAWTSCVGGNSQRGAMAVYRGSTPPEDTTPPTGAVTAPSEGSVVSSSNVTLSGWASDDESGLDHAHFVAYYNGQWQQVGPDFQSSPFNYDWNMCNNGVPDGQVTVGLDIWDKAGNEANSPNGHRHFTKNYDCSPVEPTPTPPPAGDWHVEYFNDKRLGSRCYEGWENSTYIFKDWQNGGPASGCNSDNFSARFTRQVDFEGGYYSFHLQHDDGARLFLDGEKILNAWWDGDGGHDKGVDISAGEHEVKVEYYDSAGLARVEAYWYGPGALPHADRDPSQWWGEYWGNKDRWGRPALQLNEGYGFLSKDWGNGGPGYGLPADNFSTHFQRDVYFDCGRYRFDVHTDDGMRVWVDENQEIDKWYSHVGDHSFTVDLSAGEHTIDVAHFEEGGGAALSVEWTMEQACPTATPTPTETPTDRPTPTPTPTETPSELQVIQPLTLDPANPIAGELTTASFRVKNYSDRAMDLRHVGVGAKGPGCDDWDCANSVDFPFESDVVLGAGEERTFSAQRAFFEPGADYFAQVTYTDRDDGWFPIGGRMYFSVSPGLEIAQALALSPNDPYVNEQVTAQFTVKNVGSRSITISGLAAAARGPDAEPSDFYTSTKNVGWPSDENVTLDPDEEYTYRHDRSFSQAGTGYIVQPFFEDGNGLGAWYPVSGSDISSFSVSRGLEVIEPLTLDPANPIAGELTTASFRVKNYSDRAMDLRHVGVGAKGPGCDDWDCANSVDFPFESDVVLGAGEERTFSAQRAFFEPGADYFAQVTYTDRDDRWFPIGDRVYFSVSPGLEVVQALALSPNDPYVNEQVTAQFTVKNVGNRTITIDGLAAAARGPDAEPSDFYTSTKNVGWPSDENVTLDPDEEYTYRHDRSFSQSGTGYIVQPFFEDGNGLGAWYPVSGGDISSFSVSRGLEVIEPLTLDPVNPIAGELTTASFRVKNYSDRAMDLRYIGVGAKGPGCDGWDCINSVDFPFESDVVLGAGEERTFSAQRAFFEPGADYFAQVTYTDRDDRWFPIGDRVNFGVVQKHQMFLPHISKSIHVIYRSRNLSGHQLYAECNPSDGTQCSCSAKDVDIESFRDRAEVTSNARERHTYVNAIGYKKFTEIFPDGTPIRLGSYKYTGQFRLPALPYPDLNQVENPQAVHLMLQFWDGRGSLYPSNKETFEGTIYWQLNPWEPDYGKIKVYTKPLHLIDTGISLAPDTEWHSFQLAVDLAAKSYLYVAIDGQRKNLSGIDLAQVHHPEWGEDLSLSITTESLATWPQYECAHIFKWTTQFRNLTFGSIGF